MEGNTARRSFRTRQNAGADKIAAANNTAQLSSNTTPAVAPVVVPVPKEVVNAPADLVAEIESSGKGSKTEKVEKAVDPVTPPAPVAFSPANP